MATRSTRAPRPIRGRPALYWNARAGRTIVVADLHLGLGDPQGRGVGLAEQGAQGMLEELRAIAQEVRARRVLVVGDLKHPIVGAPGRVGALLFDFCAELLSDGLELEVIAGNHDTGIARHLPREVELTTASGRVEGGVGLFHGHRWPSPVMARATTLVTGHLHPGFRLAPGRSDAAGKSRCWVRAAFVRPPGPFPGADRSSAAAELIVLPAFNPLAGIESLNWSEPQRGRSFLYRRFLAAARPRAYLLDGTDMGPILTPPSPARATRARASRDR